MFVLKLLIIDKLLVEITRSNLSSILLLKFRFLYSSYSMKERVYKECECLESYSIFVNIKSY